MRELSRFTSKVVCLPMKDIDTDMIIPARFLKVTTKEGLGEHVFANLRAADAHFPVFSGQRILVAGHNFGCGSSREHAPWALKDAGIDAIISSEFADIFRSNAEKNGIIPIVLPQEVVDTILGNPEEITVDLTARKIEYAGKYYDFPLTDFSQKRLLENLSDLDFLLELKPEIEAYDREHSLRGEQVEIP